MAEKCPLEGRDLYWMNDRERIPAICLRQCEDLWEEAMRTQPAEVDTFDENCQHDVEYGDTSLQRTDGAQRLVGILNTCMVTGEEAFADEYKFTCPYE